MSLPVARRVASEQERAAAIKAAVDDNDGMRFPTHIVLKDEKIVGSWCLGSIPLVMMWHSRTDIGAKESLMLRNMINAIMNDRAPNGYFTACNDASPYLEHMERFGYQPVWKTNLFYMK